MFIVGNFIYAVAYVIDLLISAYMFILIARVIVSWVNADPFNPIVRFLYQATEPVLSRIRRIIPSIWGGLDFSPLIAMIILVFCRIFIVQSLFQIALRLK